MANPLDAMQAIAADPETPPDARAVAEQLSQTLVRFDAKVHSPDVAAPVDEDFVDLYAERLSEGAEAARTKSVAFVGMARDLEGILPYTIYRIEELGKAFRDWRACVYENDSTDGTKQLLADWKDSHPGRVYVESVNLGREKLCGFEPLRVQAYAEYRNRLREMVRQSCGDVDYVIAVDLDAWGGWSAGGVLNGIGWMEQIPQAACMASTSLLQHDAIQVMGRRVWAHYDQWAFRLYGWTARMEPWFSLWVPPPGSPPIHVLSAFGGLAIYRAGPWLQHEYASDDGDIEHAGLHRRMIAAGWGVFLNPAQRCVMQWVPDGRDNSDNQL